MSEQKDKPAAVSLDEHPEINVYKFLDRNSGLEQYRPDFLLGAVASRAQELMGRLDEINRRLNSSNCKFWQKEQAGASHALEEEKAQLEAQLPDYLQGLPEEIKVALEKEITHPFRSPPRTLYFLCALCAGCAIVQGMDQTIINGAQVRNILHTDLPENVTDR